MAANITTKGVSASASDGLTTLAGKILQISGDTPTPSTVLFEDDCTTDRTSEYSRITSRGNATITYSSNGYYILQESSSDSDCGFLIPNVVVGSDVKISAKINIKTTGNVQGGVGFYNNSTGRSWCGRLVYVASQVNLNREYGDSSIGSQSMSIANDVWYTMEMSYENNSDISYNVYDGSGTLLKSGSGTQSDLDSTNNSPYIRLSRATNSTIWVKDIKVESIGGGSDCTQYQTEIANAIEYINGSGS